MPEWVVTFPEQLFIDIKEPIDKAIHYMVVEWDPFFNGISLILRSMLNAVSDGINLIPWWLLLAAVVLATYKISKNTVRAVFYGLMLFFIGLIGLWSLMYLTLSIVVTSVVISLLIGFPIGILAASSKKVDVVVRPILDTMQTMPSFVYLIPAVMLLGLGTSRRSSQRQFMRCRRSSG
jgi:glycine betaine/proline transport system permease protein/glycine betaine/proline transport system substrate-binding protein